MEKLFQPGAIGSLPIKNRIVMAPMGIIGLVELDGRFSERAIDFYVARAKGGAGLLITSASLVDVEVEPKLYKGHSYLPRLDSAVYITRLSELADAVHDYGAKLAVQLFGGYGRVFSTGLYPVTEPVAPSPQPWFWDDKVACRELTVNEIEKLIKAFGFAAEVAREAGVDCVEVLGHEGYLLDQFMTALWNKRTDRYGGNLEGRLNFHIEMIECIKSRVGKDFPLIYQYGVKHYIEGGRDISESQEIAKYLERAGVDALQIDAGCYESWQWAHPPIYQPEGCMIEMAAAIKQVVKIPIIAVGKLGNPELAEKILNENKADFVALARPLLADPEWTIKVKQGRCDDIRMCIGDQEGCLGRIFTHKYLSCTVNPQAGMERKLELSPTQKKKSVLTIGGGPAGMEAAMVAALRGHQVILWEKTNKLGGNLIPASTPEFKKDIRYLVKFLSTQVVKAGVDIHLGKEATPEAVRAARPDVVIIATGARPLIPEIPGIERDIVASAIDFLMGRREAGQDVAVIGGGMIGCETAVYLAQMGKKVALVEMLQEIVLDMNFANRTQLLQMLEQSRVDVLRGTRLVEIGERGITTTNKDGQLKISADTVVLAVGLKPVTELAQTLKNQVSEVYCVGDCVEARRILNAIWEGFRVGLLI